MKIMHKAVTKMAQDEDFHNQAERVSSYHQIEVTYSCTEVDVDLMVYVP
jgi:hypothetical protein